LVLPSDFLFFASFGSVGILHSLVSFIPPILLIHGIHNHHPKDLLQPASSCTTFKKNLFPCWII
jgi:hypothetical protein